MAGKREFATLRKRATCLWSQLATFAVDDHQWFVQLHRFCAYGIPHSLRAVELNDAFHSSPENSQRLSGPSLTHAIRVSSTCPLIGRVSRSSGRLSHFCFYFRLLLILVAPIFSTSVVLNLGKSSSIRSTVYRAGVRPASGPKQVPFCAHGARLTTHNAASSDNSLAPYLFLTSLPSLRPFFHTAFSPSLSCPICRS